MNDPRQEIERIEDGIRKLKVQYELYFAGAEKLPPNKLREEVDKLVKKNSNVSFQRAADRFYFNNVQSRYNAYAELWNKQLRIREEGRLPSGRPAARAGSLPVGLEGRPGAGARARAARPEGSSAETVRVSLETLEDGALRRLYDRFSAARSRAGQTDGTPAYERFREQVRLQLEALRQKGQAAEVEFRVSVEDRKVSLKARPVR